MQRLNQHRHAARRTPAGDGEGDIRGVKRFHCRQGARRQHLVRGDKRAIHVGDHKGDPTRLGRRLRHVLLSSPGPKIERQRLPSRAMSSSAWLGPALPAG